MAQLLNPLAAQAAAPVMALAPMVMTSTGVTADEEEAYRLYRQKMAEEDAVRQFESALDDPPPVPNVSTTPRAEPEPIITPDPVETIPRAEPLPPEPDWVFRAAQDAVEIERQGFDAATGIARDAAGAVVDGVPQMPRAIVYGGIEALNELNNAVDSVADELGRMTGFAPGIEWYRDENGDLQFRATLSVTPSDGGDVIPNLAEPDAKMAEATAGIAQFLVGFGVAGRALKGAGAFAQAGNITKSTIQGAASSAFAFDPREERLSDLIENVPELSNPVTAFLATSPDDHEALARLKSAVEGTVPGSMVDAFVGSMRAYRARRAVAKSPDIRSGPPIKPGLPNGFKLMGDVNSPDLVSEVAPPATKTIDGDLESVPEFFAFDLAKQATPAGKYLDINFARIESADDVKAIMAKMQSIYAKEIDEARRGVQTWEQSKENASKLDAWNLLLSRRQGQAFNVEETVALRQLWVSSSERLKTMADLAAFEPSDANLYAFRRMVQVQNLIQREVMAVRAETARALGVWRMPQGSGATTDKMIMEALAQSGGPEVTRAMAERYSRMVSQGLDREAVQFIEKSFAAKSVNAVQTFWINALLSSPSTHVVNTMSNGATIIQQIAERRLAGEMSRLMGKDNGVALEEAGEMMFAITETWKDALRFGWKTMKTGETGQFGTKVEAADVNAISSEAFGISSDTTIGRATDALGFVIGLPGRSMQAQDEFFKTIGYRMELRAQAVRTARRELTDQKITPDQFKARVAELVENPPEEMQVAALDQAAYQTFTGEPGRIAQKLLAARAEYPALTFVLPFVKTPSNIFNYSMERTPLAPLFQRWRDDIAAGGARADIAMARMASGTMTFLMALDMAQNGIISGKGPSDPNKRAALMRSGWQPYSVNVNGQWVPYARFDPIASSLSLAADLNEILAAGDPDDAVWAEQRDASIVAVLGAIANSQMSKTYMSGMAEFVEMISDPVRYGESWEQGMVGSFVPGIVSTFERVDDPYVRYAKDSIETMRSRIPGLSDDMPLRRDLWGRPISQESDQGRYIDVVSPFRARTWDPEPVDDEMMRLGQFIGMPQKSLTYNKVKVDLGNNLDIYSRYLELQGNELKLTELKIGREKVDLGGEFGALDLLNAIVSGEHPLSDVYKDLSDDEDGGKIAFIRSVTRQYRAAARAKLFEEFPRMREEVEARLKRGETDEAPTGVIEE